MAARAITQTQSTEQTCEAHYLGRISDLPIELRIKENGRRNYPKPGDHELLSMATYMVLFEDMINEKWESGLRSRRPSSVRFVYFTHPLLSLNGTY